MSKHSKSKSSKQTWKDVICPKCGAWKLKKCKFTKGSKKGEYRTEPHPERESLAKAPKQKVAAEDPKIEKKKAEAKNPLSKCTPEQKQIIEVIMDKTVALGRTMDFVGPVTVGPYVTTYRFRPGRRTKVKQLEMLGGDYAVALGRESVLVKMMPGDSAVGVFVANEKKQRIELKDTLEHVAEFMHQETEDGHLPIPLNFGMDVAGKPYIDDLTMQPHLLVAGTTGSGKSTGIRAILLSMLFAMTSKQLQVIISDTKGVEFKNFQGIPHLLKHPRFGAVGYCNSVYSTMGALEHCVQQTQERYNLLGEQNVMNIHQYNAKVPEHAKLPFIVIFIDELADLLGMEQSRSEAKANVEKLKVITARSRAAGIYVVAATQRPDVKTVIGAIKANFPARLSFRLPSHRDSSTILGTTGAQHLMTRGDMLYTSAVTPALRRLHAPWTSIEDVRDLLESITARESQLSNSDGSKEGHPGSTFRSSIN
jgi:S-DNA-T family DNA segregation ATPase FtsK/SpoIIIE